jgi:glucose/arabinose dehydrogenase
MGGDEINIIEKGKNYGWPRVSFGVNYDGTPVGTGKAEMDGVTNPIWHWTPSIAPSGMAFLYRRSDSWMERQLVERRAEIRALVAA